MTGTNKRDGGEVDHSQCSFSTGICGAITAGTGKLDDNGYWEHPCGECATKANLEAMERALAESRAEVERLRGHNAQLSGERFSDRNHAALQSRITTAEARAERLAEAGKRVTAAFRALGGTSGIAISRHQECEAAMIALDATLNLEPTP